MVHLPGWFRHGHRVLDLVEAEGADLRHTVLCHMNPSHDDVAYQTSLAERGAFIEYDMIGMDYWYADQAVQCPSDEENARAIRRLVDLGHGDRVLLSQDVFLKMMLTRYGGFGYACCATSCRACSGMASARRRSGRCSWTIRAACSARHDDGAGGGRAMARTRVLLAGESWVSAAVHHKGWDHFGSVTFHLGAEPLVAALADSPFDLHYMPAHEAATRFPLTLEGPGNMAP